MFCAASSFGAIKLKGMNTKIGELQSTVNLHIKFVVQHTLQQVNKALNILTNLGHFLVPVAKHRHCKTTDLLCLLRRARIVFVLGKKLSC